jgi:hypothetical protein
MKLPQVNSISLPKITKANLKKYIVEQLSQEPEVEKVIIFGSFLKSNTPNDIDIAIFQNSCQTYLTLALKYRKLLRPLYSFFPIDVIPLRSDAQGSFINEIMCGEVIFER